MGKFLNLFKSKIAKADAIENPWGLARYLARKHDGVSGNPKRDSEGFKRIAEYAAALSDTSVQNRGGKNNRVAGTSGTSGPKRTRGKKGGGRSQRDRQRGAGVRSSQGGRSWTGSGWKGGGSNPRKKSSDHITEFVNFLNEGNVNALNKMISEVDDSPEGLFMQAVRKAMGIHSEQYKDVGKPQFLKKAAKSEPLQKVSNQLAAFLAGLAISDQFVENPRGRMTPAQQREWERSLNRQMKRKSLKDGISMDDLQKHWSDSSDTYVRKIPVAKGVIADETFLNKKQMSPPRPGEIWNPQSHRWTKAGNLGQMNVGSGGKKRLRAGSSATGAHQKTAGGLSGKGQRAGLTGTSAGGRVHRTTVDVAEQARGTKAGVGSGKSPSSAFRTGAKGSIKRPTNKTGSGAFKAKPKTRRTTKRSKPKRLNVNR
jgi:hypothetical protein